MNELVYTFENQNDAGSYLRQIATLWTAWVVGLAGLLVTQAVVLVVWAVVVFVALFLLARPIQARAEAAVPENQVEGGVVNTALRGGTTRDRALRELAYGTAPLRVALRTVGRSERWVMVRHLVVALTILATLYVFFGTRP